MAPPRIFDHTNAEIKLGRRLGVGGEGAVYEISSNANYVAKLYHSPPIPERREKLRLMAQSAPADLLKFAAWPVSTLHERPGGPVHGFVMPRVAGKEIPSSTASITGARNSQPPTGNSWRMPP